MKINLKEVIAAAKQSEATPPPAAPAAPAPAADPFASLKGNTDPAVAPPAPAANANPLAALVGMTVEQIKSAPPTEAPAVAAEPIHTPMSEASFRYINQAEKANDDATRELWLSMDTLTKALVAYGAHGQNAPLEDAFSRILNHIQHNPNLAGILLPEDIGQMTSALAATANIVITKKTENKKKRAKKSAEPDPDIMAGLAALGFGQ